jgi:murein DD-endopeptidase MepM/ murein hydrolase activator NlpD
MRTALRISFWIVFLGASVACIGWSYRHRWNAEQSFSAQAAAARSEGEEIQHKVVLFTKSSVPAKLPFSSFLRSLGLDAVIVGRMVAAAQPVFNLRQLRAGNQLSIGRSVMGGLREVRYRIDSDRVLSIQPSGNDFHSEIQTIPSETESVGIVGKIDDSLFQAVVDAGEKPELAMRLAAIFAFDLDFYTDPRPGDTFRMVVEKKRLLNGSQGAGETISYGRILLAEYNNAGHVYRAVLFHDASGHEAYYTPEGKSMKKAFLHSPLKFAAPITSHFSMHRFHPILKEYRAHMGIDYAAPTGTPVQSIGEGRVTYAGMKGGDGNLVKVEHSNGYATYYMHLSRILVRNGQRVDQGQSIGLVGMTGLATGPHLDFRIQQHGQFLNFEKLGLPTADPISKHDWAAFAAARDQALALMPSLPSAPQTAVAHNIAPASPAAASRATTVDRR